MSKLKVNVLWLWNPFDAYASYEYPDSYDTALENIKKKLGGRRGTTEALWYGYPHRQPTKVFLKDANMYSGCPSVVVPVTSTLIRENPFGKLVLINPQISSLLEEYPKAYLIPTPQEGQQIKIIREKFPLNELREKGFRGLEAACLETVPDDFPYSEKLPLGIGEFDSPKDLQQSHRLVRFE